MEGLERERKRLQAVARVDTNVSANEGADGGVTCVESAQAQQVRPQPQAPAPAQAPAQAQANANEVEAELRKRVDQLEEELTMRKQHLKEADLLDNG